MIKLIYILKFTIFFSLLASANDLSQVNKAKKLSEIISKELDQSDFSISPPNQSNNFITTIELSPSLGVKYKNKFHQWILDSASIDKSFERVHVSMANTKGQSSQLNLILFSIFLLIILYIALHWISSKSMKTVNETQKVLANKFGSIEEKVTHQVEQKVINELSREKQ